MTKEEIKEMIDATINTNGNREITGHALNLALNAIVEAMGEGGGAGAETVYGPDGVDEANGVYLLTEEHKTVNAAVYAKCKEATEAKKTLPVLWFDFTGLYRLNFTSQGIEAGGISAAMSVAGLFIGEDSPLIEMAGASGLCVFPTVKVMESGMFLISEDGSITEVQM
jgi:hypothetical protein